MVVFPLLVISFMMKFVAFLFVIVAVLLILLILIQKGKGGGLTAAFGGGAGGGLWGAKTGDKLTWITVGLAGIFLILALVMSKCYKPTIKEIQTRQAQQTQQQAQQQLPKEQADMQMPKTIDTNE